MAILLMGVVMIIMGGGFLVTGSLRNNRQYLSTGNFFFYIGIVLTVIGIIFI